MSDFDVLGGLGDAFDFNKYGFDYEEKSNGIYDKV